MQLHDPITSLKGVGAALAGGYARLGIASVGDLINNYPRSYEDYSVVSRIRDLRPGPVTIEAMIKQAAGKYVRRGLHITEAVASDDSGSVRLVWFNQPYRAAALQHDKRYFISGTFELRHSQFAIISPSVELVSALPTNAARILPVYRETKGLTSRQIRTVMRQVLPAIESLPETLPAWLPERYGLPGRSAALAQLHFPGSRGELEAARARLGFEEVFDIALTGLMNKREITQERAPAVPFDETVAKSFVAHLPFSLTDAQRKTIWQIYLDMQRGQPMNRLVEGDVGSGKTVVAAMAAVMVLHHGHQVAFMAPTELLARQHADTLARLLRPLGLDRELGLLVGSMSVSQKQRARRDIAAGRIRFMVGTQALIQEKIAVRKLELIVIDEQHRFGVDQRKELMAKAGHMPHVLSLTATPIPRSLALTLYGELDVSILDTKPAGRQPVHTVLSAPTSRAEVYAHIRTELDAGRQLFVVCPLIAPGDGQNGKSGEALSAEQVYERLSRHDFKGYRGGLLHGKLKPAEKAEVMQAFVDHRLDFLVATTVIEVGVDVPNASVMLIEGADRFGLAQIHQLRGRIGRGAHAGYCYLMLSDARAPSPRLRALERTNDGFKLAELDLRLRGPGAIYGRMQHGQLDLRIAQLTDARLIARARQAAQAFLGSGEDLHHYAELYQRIRRLQAVTNLN